MTKGKRDCKPEQSATSFPGFSPTRPLSLVGRVGKNPGNEVELGENDHRSPSNRAQGLLQPQNTETPEENVKIVPICLILMINPTKRSSVHGNHGSPASSAPFLWISMLDIARFIAQFNYDFPLSNCMEHGAVRIRP